MDLANPLEIFESIFGTSKAFVYRCHNDKDYTMQYMFGQVEELTGYQVDEIQGNAVTSFVGITHPDDKERVFAIVDEAIENRAPWNIQYRLIGKDGSVVNIREDGSAVFDASGELVFLQGLITDAAREIELREKIEDSLSAQKIANDEFLQVASRLGDSLRTLSFVAVNARIEAARVGSAGQGFAVIASDMADLLRENSEIVAILEDKIRTYDKVA